MFTGLVDGIKQILGGIIEFLTGVFTGDWDRAWNGVKDIFKGVWNVLTFGFRAYKGHRDKKDAEMREQLRQVQANNNSQTI